MDEVHTGYFCIIGYMCTLDNTTFLPLMIMALGGGTLGRSQTTSMEGHWGRLPPVTHMETWYHIERHIYVFVQDWVAYACVRPGRGAWVGA